MDRTIFCLQFLIWIFLKSIIGQFTILECHKLFNQKGNSLSIVHKSVSPFKKLTNQNYMLTVSEEKCVFTVRMFNCRSSSREAPKVSLYSTTTILQSVDIYGVSTMCSSIKRVKYVWRIWNMDENHNESKDTPIVSLYDENVLKISRNFTHYGLLKIKLFIQVSLKGEFLSKQAYCFIDLVPTPTQTIIFGGNDRSVYFKENLNFEVMTLSVPYKYLSTGQLKTFYAWRCNGTELFCREYTTSEPLREIHEPFSPSRNYNFSLDTRAMDGNGRLTPQHTEHQTVHILLTPVLKLLLKCQKNCGGSVFKSNPKDQILLEAIILGETEEPWAPKTYHWQYKEVGSDNLLEVDNIIDKQNGISSFLLIEDNKLKEGGKYLFYVKVDSESWSSISIEIDKAPQKLNCTSHPQQGMKGITQFSIDCRVEESNKHFPFHDFELLDGTMESGYFSGRHLGFSLTGNFHQILLTRGTLLVRAINFFGTWSEIQLQVSLEPTLKDYSINIPSNGDDAFNHYIDRVRCISAASDLIGTKPSWLQATNLFLSKIEKEDIVDINGALLLGNTLNHIACKMLLTKTSDSTDCRIFLNIAKIMYRATNVIKHSVNNPWENSRLMSSIRVREYALSILLCSSVVLEAKRLHKDETVDTHNCLKESTFFTVQTLQDLAEIIAVTVRPVVALKMPSGIIQITVQNYFMGQNSVALRFLNTFIKFPTNNMRKIIQFSVQIIEFQINPFWWGGGNKINTDVLSISLKNIDIEERMVINESFSLSLKLNPNQFKPLLISGSVIQPDPRDGPQANDFKVVVFRIDPEIQTNIVIQFIDLQDSSLRMVILKDKRPDFDYMRVNSSSVSQYFNRLDFEVKKDKSFVYLGILPGKNVKIGHQANFKFYLYGTRCAIWKYSTWLYPNEKCSASLDEFFSSVVCECSLLTLTIGAYAYVPLNDLNPFSDIHLLLHSSENPFILVILLVLSILFVISFIWARKNDLEDKKQTSVITVEENSSQSRYCYLTGVFTSARLFAGTTSKVGVKLVGETTSKTFVLQSRDRSVFQSSSDDWFLLFSNKPLGSLLKLQLWISYSGLHPNWHCTQIFICNINTYETNTFIVDRWFGVSKNGVCLDMLCNSASSKEINNFNVIFFDNLTSGLLEFPIWTSLIFRHPRSLTSRCQSLNIVACYLMTSILVTVLIHSTASPFEEDYYKFEIRRDSIVVGLLSAFSANFVCWIIMYIYRRSYSINCKVDACHIHHDTGEIYQLKNSDSLLIETLTRLIKSVAGHCKMIPVKNKENLISVEVDFKKKLQAWLLCIIVVISSFCFIVNASLKFGPRKTSVCLASLVFSLVLSCFVITPMKILVISLLLSLVKTRLFNLLCHYIDINKPSTSSTQDKSQSTSKDYSFSSAEHINSYERAYKNHQLMFYIFTFGFIIESVIFLCLVFWVSMELETGKHFVASEASCNQFQKYASCEGVRISELQSFSYFNILYTDILPMLYKTKWYNNNNLSVSDSNSRLIGVPYLRQVRVKKHFCKIPKVMRKFVRNCNPVLYPWTEDMSNYSMGWTKDGWGNILFSESPWEYSLGSGIGLKTPNNNYIREGSYIVVFFSDLESSQEVIKNLIDTRWINEQTRVVVLEFLTYNPNTNLFTFMSIITELFPSRLIRVTASAHCNRLYSQNVTTAGVAFTSFTIYFFLRLLVFLNMEGFTNFFKDCWHWYDFLVVFLGIFGAVHYLQLIPMIVEVENQAEFDKTRNVNLEFVFQLSESCRVYLGLAFCGITLRLIKVTKLNRNCRMYLTSLRESTLEMVFSIASILLIMYVHFRLIMFLVEPPVVTSFADVLQFQSDFDELIKEISSNGGKFCILILKKITDLTIFSITVTLIHHQRQIQLRTQQLYS